jgi:uncharacterized membrane protein
MFVHVLFALHYPGHDRPGFGEFLHFAFTVGMAFQVSDATTATAAMRRLVTLHALVSLLFNAVILAAAVDPRRRSQAEAGRDHGRR